MQAWMLLFYIGWLIEFHVDITTASLCNVPCGVGSRGQVIAETSDTYRLIWDCANWIIFVPAVEKSEQDRNQQCIAGYVETTCTVHDLLAYRSS